MAWQDVRHEYTERDDDPPARTVPENPTPGQRYMQENGGGLWDVRELEVCPCDCGAPPHPACVVCGGRGEYVADGFAAESLTEADARLLVFGGELLAAAGEAIRSLDLASDDPTGRTYPLYVKLREALANVKGG